MDQLNPDLQDVCYLTAIEIAKKLSCLVIISMREERYFRAKVNGVLDAYHTPGYHLSAPVIPEVIIRRLSYIVEKLEYTPDVDVKYNIQYDNDLLQLLNFLKYVHINSKKRFTFIKFSSFCDAWGCASGS